MKEVEDYSRVHRGRQFPEVTFDRIDSPENEKCRHVDTTTAGFKDVIQRSHLFTTFTEFFQTVNSC
jgi:hypothetical protein